MLNMLINKLTSDHILDKFLSIYSPRKNSTSGITILQTINIYKTFYKLPNCLSIYLLSLQQSLRVSFVFPNNYSEIIIIFLNWKSIRITIILISIFNLRIIPFMIFLLSVYTCFSLYYWYLIFIDLWLLIKREPWDVIWVNLKGDMGKFPFNF